MTSANVARSGVYCTGVPIRAVSPAEAAAEVVALATAPPDGGADVHLCNAYTLALAAQDPQFHALLRRAQLNYPDGKSVVWANRIAHRGQSLPSERVYGPDLFLDVFALGEQIGLRHYLLGSTPKVLADLAAELRRRFPDAAIVGTESPPFRALSEQEKHDQAERIRASGAQLVWVGLGTPKQDWESADLAARTGLVCCAVGAAFDFVAGHKRQAPRWMQRRGLEWVFRLFSEPRRLWRRYLFGNLRFVIAVVRSLARRG